MADEFFRQLPKFDPADAQTYDATCHCGTVKYSVTLTPPLPKWKVCSCNCSICARNGYLLVYPLREQLKVTSGEDALKSYSFGRKMNQHKFCTNCGSSVFFDPRMKEQGYNLDLLGINVRMFKGVSLDELNLVKFDGWSGWPFVDSDHLK
ncbi:uncharacterized protein BDR25DRAFT_81122 [Lindgomyces ingoldianus]|uniref:Uncharacterized protein n=1 Tax=Lindgomyces ingoldianus TaxID=673940 RepID=A0ACB6QGC0_9PLEO|nr:uncharacterized protein BDR25DRAFT_81122 [Lindgomyces ingoldianus]KAF2465930.1 hypothetical protein BDR25DRAFT_81122 [Lindgomyces ingoldianus]